MEKQEFNSGWPENTHKIKWLVYNWFWSSDENAEGFEKAEIGMKGVTEIHEHQPGGPGDLWYYDVHTDNGRVTRVFNPNQVGYELKTEEK